MSRAPIIFTEIMDDVTNSFSLYVDPAPPPFDSTFDFSGNVVCQWNLAAAKSVQRYGKKTLLHLLSLYIRPIFKIWAETNLLNHKTWVLRPA
ncbi:10480_t:CDS:2, partial [Scutellospora calospora]